MEDLILLKQYLLMLEILQMLRKFCKTVWTEYRKVLQSLIVSSPFTIYQLANMIINELPDGGIQYRIQTLSLAKECYSMQLDLLTNATVVDDAIRFVSSRPKRSENHILKATMKNQWNLIMMKIWIGQKKSK